MFVSVIVPEAVTSIILNREQSNMHIIVLKLRKETQLISSPDTANPNAKTRHILINKYVHEVSMLEQLVTIGSV